MTIVHSDSHGPGNSYMNPISAILGPARNVVDAAAATIVDDVDRLGLRRPRAQRRKCRCNDAVSYRVISPRHFQAFGVFLTLCVLQMAEDAR